MTKTQMLRMWLSTLAGAALLAGCGSSSSADAVLNKSEFIKKADIICEKGSREQYRMALRYLGKHPGATESDAAEVVAIPPLEKQLRELQRLGRPREDGQLLNAYYRAYDKALAVSSQEPKSITAVTANPFATAVKLGKKYGFVDCRVLP